MNTLKINNESEKLNTFLQKKLQNLNFYQGNVDGQFGPKTESAVKKFQTHYSLTSDGVVGNITASILNLNFKIDKSLTLKPESYFNQETEKTACTIHHISGWTITKRNIANNNFFYGWKDDGRRIATHFSIDIFGKIYQHFPLKNWAHHLGLSSPYNSRMNKESFSVELANEGPIERNGKGNWSFWAGELKRDVNPTQHTWRGHEFWANYTDKQYKSLSKLLLYLNIAHNIEIKYPKTQLEMQNDIINSIPYHGIYSHSNVRNDKVDVSPDFKWNKFFKQLESKRKKHINFLNEPDLTNSIKTKRVDTHSLNSSDYNVKEALEKVKNIHNKLEKIKFLENDPRITIQKRKQKLENEDKN